MKTINFSDQVYEYAGLIPEHYSSQPELGEGNSGGKAIVLIAVVLTVGVISYIVLQHYQAQESEKRL